MARQRTSRFTWLHNIKIKILGLPQSKSVVRITRFTQRRPLLSFVSLLGLVLILIIISSIISNLNQTSNPTSQPVKEVHVFSIGVSPKVALQAKIEKAGVVKITAQTAGIVQSVNLKAGDSVSKGQALLDLSTNAAGQDASALQAALAGEQYTLANTTYNSQKDILAQQREVANQTAENTEQLRQISEQSLSDTRDVLNTNISLINNVNSQISALESTPQTPDAAQTLAQLKQSQAQLSSAISQLQAQVRTSAYQVNPSNPPTQLANLQKDITLKQLNLQEKTLQLQQQISGIQSQIAQITASLMHPASPFDGTVERINVYVGQSISPGTVIATVSSDNQSVQAIVNLPQSLAQTVSRIQPSQLSIDNQQLSLFPQYITTDATDGELYSVIYYLPNSYAAVATDQSYLPIEVPLGVPNTSAIDPYVPIDSVFQSQDQSYVFVVKNKHAVSREITLGQVYGKYVQVLSGISSGDQIITDRTVIDGDPINIIH